MTNYGKNSDSCNNEVCGVCLMNTMKEMMGFFTVSDIEVHVWCVSHEYYEGNDGNFHCL